jgi:hypothetical protein
VNRRLFNVTKDDRSQRGVRACLALMALATGSWAKAQDVERDEAPWEVAPYRVRVLFAAEAPGDAELEARLARYLHERAGAALRPAWDLGLVRADDARDRAACFDLREISWEDLGPENRSRDKILWLGVRREPAGFELGCREFDVHTRRWGPVLRREAAQRASLGEACFRMLTSAFSPLARFESADDGQARLVMRGGALPRPVGPDLVTAPGDVYLPLLRRTGRGGELVEGGIAPLPWTYLIAAKPDGSAWLAEVVSALPQPLAGRRRGTIEPVAIALRSQADRAHVRFFARSNREQGLAGYEVLRVVDPKQSPEPIGRTGRDGVIDVPLDGQPTATLLLRSDGQVLAKLVVAAGAASVLEAPIADDRIRLAAQAEVQAAREEVVDVVARRAILIARVEALLKQGQAAEARALMTTLNDLPTSTVMRTRLDDVAKRLPTSDDPRVRQNVDGLFTATRELVARFLDSRVITDLQARVNEALRGGS